MPIILFFHQTDPKTLVHVLVFSHLYSSQVYSAARVFFFYKSFCSLGQQLQWILVTSHINYKIILMTYKVLHGCAPLIIWDLIIPYHVHLEPPVYASWLGSSIGDRSSCSLCIELMLFYVVLWFQSIRESLKGTLENFTIIIIMYTAIFLLNMCEESCTKRYSLYLKFRLCKQLKYVKYI